MFTIPQSVQMRRLLKRTNSPLDTNIVFLHKLLIAVMLTMFAYCKYAELERQSPSCSGSGIINLTHKRKFRLCITTAAYVEHEGQRKYTNIFGLYLPPALFVMALLYMIPLKYQDFYESERLVALFEEAPRLPRAAAVRNIDVVMEYSYRLFSTRLRLSWECLEVNLVCLLMLNMITSTNLLTTIILGGITGGWVTWQLSFPTTVSCEIGPQMVYAAGNTELYSCTIPHNEIYKNIWLVSAGVALIATFLSLLSIVYHILEMLPFRHKRPFKGIVDMDNKTLELLADELLGGNESVFLLRSYLLRLPKEYRKDVVMELLEIIKKSSW